MSNEGDALRALAYALKAAHEAANSPEGRRRRKKFERYTAEVAAMYDDPPPEQVEAIRDYIAHTYWWYTRKGRTEKEFDRWHARDLERLDQARQKRRIREAKRTLTAIRKVLRDQPQSPPQVSATATTTQTSSPRS